MDSALDVIAEKATNIEKIVQSKSVQESIAENLRLMAKREKSLRESTVTIKNSDKLSPKQTIKTIEEQYCAAKAKSSATYWQDKDNTYAQFVSRSEKNDFLDYASTSTNMGLKEAICKPNELGEHVTRKPARIIINNVRRAIKLGLVEESLKRVLKGENSIQNLREGKANAITGARSILFSTNQEGLRALFGLLDGALPYFNSENDEKTRLYMKINCKPWACRDCFTFGPHQCLGKVCANCGMAGHLTKDCRQKTRYCRNCKQKGHRAKDAICPKFLTEVAKEVRKIEIPMEFLEDPELRLNLAKNIQFS